MIKMRDLILEKKLRVFDFDDTLVKTNSFIYVKHKDGKESKLSPGEYAKYVKKSGDEFDYRDFQSIKEPKEIISMKKLFNKIKTAPGRRVIVILTARGVYKPIRKFLDDAGYGKVYVVALGDSNPKSKVKWIEKKIKNGYDDIVFWDDSIKNVKAVAKLQKKYPNIKLKSNLVKF